MKQLNVYAYKHTRYQRIDDTDTHAVDSLKERSWEERRGDRRGEEREQERKGKEGKRKKGKYYVVCYSLCVR